MKTSFNVRVYGLLINDAKQVLISDEEILGRKITKFPGGGLEYGEGLADALVREFWEECSLNIHIISHFYTTDFFVKSAFDDTQVISVYYLVKAEFPLNFKISTSPFDFDPQNGQAFRWINIKELDVANLTFPIDKHVTALLKEKFAQ
jgi:ADP-ribose pyrophosphatase YjhB (NUDIX family)